MSNQLERPHFTDRFPTLDAVRSADRIAPSLVRHRLETVRGALRGLLRTDWTLIHLGSAFWSHCIELQLDRFSRERRARLERAAEALRADGAEESRIDAMARQKTKDEYER